jgi:hypothetical protein
MSTNPCPRKILDVYECVNPAHVWPSWFRIS